MATIGNQIDNKISTVEAKAEAIKTAFLNEYGQVRQFIAAHPLKVALSVSGVSFILGLITGVIL